MKSLAVKENLIALVVALIISFLLFMTINKFDFLKADIMAPNKESGSTVTGDVVTKFSGSSLVLNSNKKIEGMSNISFFVSYDFEKITINKENIESKNDFGMSQSSSKGRMSIYVPISSNSLEKGENIINIGFDGESNNINISDVIITFTDGTTESLSVANK